MNKLMTKLMNDAFVQIRAKPKDGQNNQIYDTDLQTQDLQFELLRSLS